MNDRDFINTMWYRIEEKEKEKKLYEYVSNFPRNISIKEFFIYLFKKVGLMNLFRNITDVFVLSYGLTIIVMSVSANLISENYERIYGWIFFIAPLFYGLLFTLSCLKEKQQKMLQIEMTCKYTFFHIIALRMVIISLLGLFMNYIYIVILTDWYELDFLRLLILSFTAQTVFSVLLAGTLFVKKPFPSAICAVFGWYAVNGILYNSMPSLYIQFMEGTSMLVIGSILAAALFLNIYFVKMIMEEKAGRYKNA